MTKNDAKSTAVTPNGESRHDLSTELALGGQALIEGVLMRSPHHVAMAARTPEGEIVIRDYDYTPITRRVKWLGLPIIRGAVGLVESLKIGMDALSWSAEQAMPKEAGTDKASKAGKVGMIFSMLLALVISLGLFMYFPLWIGKLIAPSSVEHTALRQVIINLVAGGVRISILLGYLWVISMMKDIHRVFQYHGSEHKSIYAFESGEELTETRVLKQTRFHPRCGTSFLLIVALAAIVFFVIVDSIVVATFGEYPGVWARFLVHVPLIPLVAGISYEFLKYSAKHTDNRLVWALIQPGLWLQRITTQEPDGPMCEVAMTALKTALTGEKATTAEPAVVPEQVATNHAM